MQVALPSGAASSAPLPGLASGFISSPGEAWGWSATMPVLFLYLDLQFTEEPEGEMLLDAVWDANWGEPIGEATVDLARRLVGQEI